MKFRTVEISESKELATIHLETFKGFFLTLLGLKFLNTYYKACIKSNESIVICATDEYENIIGFSVGCTHSKGYHKRLIKQNIVPFMVQAIIILFSNPAAIIRLGKNLGKNSDKKDNGNYAELLSIGVLPTHNGQGIGKELIKMFEAEAVDNGCTEIALTTDFYDNDRVLKFYKNTGYEILYKFITYPNRKMYKLIKNLK